MAPSTDAAPDRNNIPKLGTRPHKPKRALQRFDKESQDCSSLFFVSFFCGFFFFN